MNELNPIMKAAAEDALDIAIKLAGWFVPKKTIGATAQALAKKFSHSHRYLNWERTDWQSFYRHEQNLVTLRTSANDMKLDAVVLLQRNRNSATPVEFELDQTLFTLPASVVERTSEGADDILKSGDLFDGCNVRLKAIRGEDERAVLLVQPARYHDYIRSNLCLDFRLKPGVSTLREEVHADGALDGFQDSPLANLIGINMLVFTPSGKLVVPTRSAKATFRRGTHTPSSSGTLEPSDVLAKNFFAETHRELGLTEADVQSGPHFVGMSRELVRGGQPEMFFFATVKRTTEEIHRAWKSAQERDESEKLECFDGFGHLVASELREETERREFQRAFDRLVHHTRAKASLPLLTNLALWRNYMLCETTTPSSCTLPV